MNIDEPELEAEQLRIATERAEEEAGRQRREKIAREDSLQKRTVRDAEAAAEAHRNDYGISTRAIDGVTGKLSGGTDWATNTNVPVLVRGIDGAKASWDYPIDTHGQGYEYYPAATGDPNVPMWHPGDKPRATAPAVFSEPADPPAPSEADRLKAYMAMFGNRGGGMAARINSDQTGGYQEQRDAALSMVKPIDDEAAGRVTARAGIQALGAKYVTDLGLAQKKQQDLIDQRKSAIAEESRANKEAEGSFDSMRLTRKLGENPISSAVMSFAAGLVGSLKGAAGDTSPNMILGEVDKAVERDVMNQKVQYERMRNGQDSARTNFTDEMKMGETEQTALLKATSASMDQHARALEYAAARIDDAQKKANVLGAAGQLRSQHGQLRYSMDVQKAQAANASAAQNQALKMRWLQAEQTARAGNPEAQTEADHKYGQLKEWDKTLDVSRSLAAVAKEAASISDADLKSAFSKDWFRTLKAAVDGLATKEHGVIAANLGAALSAALTETTTHAEQAIIRNMQAFQNFQIKERHGGNVTNPEQVRSNIAYGMSTPSGFKAMLRREVQADLAHLKTTTIRGDTDPYLKRMLDSSLGDTRDVMESYLSGTDTVAGLNAAPTAGSSQ